MPSDVRHEFGHVVREAEQEVPSLFLCADMGEKIHGAVQEPKAFIQFIMVAYGPPQL